MKALILTEYNKFEFKDVPEPEIKDNEVLIRVKACGICGSDVHGMDGSTGRRIPPVIMGHEASGVIAETGKNATGWEKGDRVTFDSTIYCGKCGYCIAGKINLCSNRRVAGVSCAEYRQNGAFAEYISVPEHILYRLPDGISFEEAAMAEALSIAVHAAGRSPVKHGNIAVVVGAGMIGLLIIQALKIYGAGSVIAADIDPYRLAAAEKLGADFTVNTAQPDADKKILDLTGGEGADHAYEAVGITSSVKTAFDALKKGGSLVLVGNISPEISFPLQAAVTREITVYGSCASSGEYPLCLKLIADKKIDVRPLISMVAPLEEGAVWFKKLYGREPGLFKVILTP